MKRATQILGIVPLLKAIRAGTSLVAASEFPRTRVPVAAPASRASRHLRPSESSRLVVDMDDAYGHEITWHGTTSSKVTRHVNFRGSLGTKGFLGERGPGVVPTICRSLTRRHWAVRPTKWWPYSSVAPPAGLAQYQTAPTGRAVREPINHVDKGCSDLCSAGTRSSRVRG